MGCIMGMLSCVVGSDQWTCTLKKDFWTEKPVLVVTRGKENDIPESFKEIDLTALWENKDG